MSKKLPIVALISLLTVGLLLPLTQKSTTAGFYIEVLLGGLMSGVMYSLVALGFVLIYKASGVFNFAQGAMVLFAALAVARLSGEGLSAAHFWVVALLLGGLSGVLALGFINKGGAAKAAPPLRFGLPAAAAIGAGVLLSALFGTRGWPLWLAMLGAGAVMVCVAMAIEKLVLRPLVNQEGVVLLMATLGVTYFLDGLGQTLWGSSIYKIELGVSKDPVIVLDKVFEGGILINQIDVFAAVVATVLVAALALFFQKTPVGRALRAVADDHQAAQSIGIPLNRIWVIVWSVAGVVALVAGMIWGAKLGVQFSLVEVALKALPVVILGGLTSVPGAILGGLIIGVGEKMAEVFLGPLLGGGIEYWFAYVLALLFLIVRPEGLFGEKHIDRV